MGPCSQMIHFSRKISQHHVAARPNKGVELTAYSVRCAPASSRSSGLAFGCADENRQCVKDASSSQGRSSQPPWPRVMRRRRSRRRRSVDRGCAGGVLRLAIGRLLGADVVRTHGRQHGVTREGEGDTDPAGSETPRMHRSTRHGNRESLGLPADSPAGRQGKSKATRRRCTDPGSRMGA